MGALLLISAFSFVTFPGADQFLAGRAAEDKGKNGDALTAYTKCLAADPLLAPYARVRAAGVRYKAGDTVGAIAEYLTIIGEGTDKPWVRMAKAKLAAAYQAQGRNAEAASLFQDVLNVSVPVRWLETYRWSLADCLCANDDTRQMGFNLFADLITTARPAYLRVDAARRLAASPDLTQRLAASLALIQYGEYKQAGATLLTIGPSLANTDVSFQAQYDYAAARILLAGEAVHGREALERVATKYPKTRWANLALAHVARSVFKIDAPADGLKLFDQLVHDYPKTDETGEALWWLADRYADKDKDIDAAVQYHRVATVSSSYPKAPDALFEAGYLYRKHGEFKKAAEVYSQLQSKYPRSPLAGAACYECGVIHETQGQMREAKADFTRATTRGIGNYYAHRALERIQELEAKEPSPSETLTTFVRPMDLPSKLLPQADATFHDAPWAERLFFFAEHGDEEAEWEAISLVDDPQVPGGALTVCLAMAESGLAASAQQVAEARGLGVHNSIPTPEWYRIMYPRAYWSHVNTVANETHVDPYLLLAVGRQESVFQPTVVSRAGATGVMQLMPDTAAWLAKVEPAIGEDDAANLHVPENSFKLGAYYLLRMIAGNDGNLVLAVASYNAGPGNVAKWRKQRPNAGMEDFIDTIPYVETREYVKKVLGNYAAYHSLYPEPARVAVVP